ncbi:MAG: hypothetical protein AAF721_06265 [Myxococcota bacterium]
MRSWVVCVRSVGPMAVASLLLVGCADERENPAMTTAADGGIPVDDGDDGDGDDDDGDGEDGGGDKLDVEGGMSGDGLPCAEGGNCDEDCVEVEHTPCDDGTTDLFNAMGLGCPGDAEVTVSVDGSLAAMGVRSSFGNTAEWAPREGTAYAVIGSGFVSDLDMETPATDNDIGPLHCNDDLGAEYDKGAMLPAPIRTTDVVGDCAADATVLGTGD